MRTGIIVILISLHSCFAYCQNDTTNNYKHGIRLSFGIAASPIWNYVKNNQDDFNFNAGLLTSINFDNWFELRTGLSVDLKKYSVYEYNLDEYKYYGKNAEIKNHYDFQYLRIPIGLSIYFLKKNPLFIYASFSIVAGIPRYNSTEFENFQSGSKKDRSIGILQGSIGLKYYLNKNFFVSVEPFMGRLIEPIEHEYRSLPCRNCGPGYAV